MSPQASFVLQEEIIPRLRASIPRNVNQVGSEDAEELIQDATCHRYSHFLTVAPFGSKLQCLGTFIFTRMHPETQIVYA
jgi:hypothetical protein